ncbi:MAG: hypothetical protein ACI4KR_12280, partial [Ruminiclostridium sp.]
MRRNRILKVIALLGAVCFTVGCSGNGAAEKATATTITTTMSTAAEAATLTEKADKDLLLVELGNGVE